MKTTKFWKNKKVLIIGHTGFHGSWLSIWLNELGAKVIGYSLEPKTDNDNYVLSNLSNKIKDYRGDIRDKSSLIEVIDEEQPEIVINLASSTMQDIKDPSSIYEGNIMGTVNVLDCIRLCKSIKVGIMVNSDKCYEDKEQIWGYRENDSIGGDEPYSASKACAELVISSYRNTYLNPKDYEIHNKAVASVRTGSVIGGGDWNEENVIPLCAKAFTNKEPAIIKCLNRLRPWQHVLEPTYGIILLAEKMYNDPTMYCESWNFGPEYSSCLTVSEAVERFKKEFRKCEILELDDNSDAYDEEAKVLDITKAKYRLGWSPKWSIDKTISYTADWYKNYKTKDVYNICKNHIEKYSLL